MRACREDRKRQRAQHKRASKAAREQKQAERNARAAALGQRLPLPMDTSAVAPVRCVALLPRARSPAMCCACVPPGCASAHLEGRACMC